MDRRRLLRRETLDEAMRDCRYVFHLAGDYRFWARDQREISRTTCRARSMYWKPLEAKIERIVYTSTTGILKRGTLDGLATEADPPRPHLSRSVSAQFEALAKRNDAPRQDGRSDRAADSADRAA